MSKTAILTVIVGAVLVLLHLVSAWLWAPPPYPQADRLFRLWEAHAHTGIQASPVSPATFALWSESARSFEAASYYSSTKTSLVEGASESVLDVRVALIHGPFFEVLGVQPKLGAARDDQTVLISFGLWQRLFGGDPHIAGKTFRLAGSLETIAGVMPEGFAFPEDVEVWRQGGPIQPGGMGRRQRSVRYYDVIARRHDHASTQQMSEELEALSQGLAEEFPVTHGGWTAVSKTFHQAETAAMQPALQALLAGAGLLFLLGMANFAHLISGDLLERRRELAVRHALGASAGQISSLVVWEASAAALAGSVLGGLLGWGALRSIGGLLPGDLPALPTGPPILWLPVACVTVAFCALLSFLVSRTGSDELLGESLRSRSSSPAAARVGARLVVVQVALAAWVLVTAGLLLRSFVALASTDPGFAVDHRHSLRFRWRVPLGQPAEDISEPMAAALKALDGMPGVRSAALATHQPLDDPLMIEEFEARGAGADTSDFRAALLVIDADFLSTMEVEILEGRGFSRQDDARAPAVALVNETLARRLWPGQPAVGQTLKRILENDDRRVVGVVSGIRSELSAAAGPQVYVPYSQHPLHFGRILLHLDPSTAGGDGGGIESQAAAVAERFSPNLRVYGGSSIADIVDSALPESRLAAVTLVILGAIALILAGSGLHAVVGRAMVQRSREMGVRQALGASPLGLTCAMLTDHLRPVCVGLALGLIASLSAAPLVANLLYGVEPADPATWIGVLLILLAVSGLAILGPVLRAVKNPTEALRRA
ncbi:MAG: ABC transporter permease [Acidobacteriota bacterium]